MKRSLERCIRVAITFVFMIPLVFQIAYATESVENNYVLDSIMQNGEVFACVILIGIAWIVFFYYWIKEKIEAHKLGKLKHEATTWLEETAKTRLNDRDSRSFEFNSSTFKEYAAMEREIAICEEQDAIKRGRSIQKRRRLYRDCEKLSHTTTTSNCGYRKRDDRNDLEKKSAYHHEDILMYGAMLFDTSEPESHDADSFDDGGYDDTAFSFDFDDSSDISSSDDFDFGGFDGDSDGGGASDDF